MTGPLAPLFAQVRETLECPNQDAPMHTRTGCTYCSATADAFAALSAIERHVQDRERERDELGPLFVRDMARLAGLPDNASMDEIHAALSGNLRHVQDMETAILRHVTQGDVTPYWSSAHLCNGKCPDLDMPDVRDPECLACLAMDFSRAALPASGTRNRVAREKGME